MFKYKNTDKKVKASDIEKQWGKDLERRGVFDKSEKKCTGNYPKDTTHEDKCKNCIDKKWKIKNNKCIDCCNYSPTKSDIKKVIKLAEKEIKEWVRFLNKLNKIK